MGTSTRLTLEELESRLVLSANLASLLAGSSTLSDYSIDGTGNNALYSEWGSTGITLLRTTSAQYGDGISTPAGENLASPREISNLVNAQSGSILNDRHLTDLVWAWGQFIDHDIDLTHTTSNESFNIAVPAGDPNFDPTGTGTQTISLNRSVYDPDSGIVTPREQINSITAWLDGSVVYGSDETTANSLRAFTGGKLLTSAGNLLPTDATGQFQAGDVRAQENVALLSLQTLWVREHNYWAEQISTTTPGLSDEAIFQQARAIVIAEIQAITYNEFLPALLGQGAISTYSGFNSEVNPGIANVFSTAAYRVGHTLLSPTLLRLNNDGTTAAEGNLDLRNAFFAGSEVAQYGIDSILKGAATQQAQEIDPYLIDDVRNFLFGQPGSGGFDLASLNIQRGRDHGLGSYNQTRIELGLTPATTFADISSDPGIQARLASAYASVDDVDVWVGALAEDHVPGSSVGELIHTVLVDQFTRIRDGDPNWYQNIYTGRLREELDRTTLADVIQRNTGLTSLQENVFYDPSVVYHRSTGVEDNLRLVVDGDSVKVINEANGRVVQSQSLATVSQVILVGADRTPDHFTIDTSRASAVVPDGIQVYGGAGAGDSLKVLSTPRADRIVLGGDSVLLNQQAITYDAVEKLILAVDARTDVVRFLSQPEARLILAPLAPPAQHGGHQASPFGPRGPMGPEALALTPFTQQLFAQLRQDVLRQAKEVLTPEQYREFARALETQPLEGDASSTNGPVTHKPQPKPGRDSRRG